jgi:hypothetical protein
LAANDVDCRPSVLSDAKSRSKEEHHESKIAGSTLREQV